MSMPPIKYIFILLALIAQVSIACERTMKIGLGQPWPPFYFEGEQTLSGIDIEVTRLILNKAGFCSEFVVLPSSIRGLVELKKGHVDLVPAASFSHQRAQYSYFSIPYRRERMRLFWYEDAKLFNHNLQSLMSLRQTFVVNNGGYYGKEFESLSSQEQFKELIVRVPMIKQRLYMLKAKRVDFMIDDETSGLYLIKQEKIAGVTLHPHVVHDNPIHFMLSRKSLSHLELKKINIAISNNQAAIKQIIESYTQSRPFLGDST